MTISKLMSCSGLCSLRKTRLKKYLFAFFLSFFILSNTSFSQTDTNGPQVNIESTPVEAYNQYFENEKIAIDYKKAECETKSNYQIEYIFFRFENKTSKKIKVRYFEYMWFDDIPAESNGTNESFREIILMPHETFESNCACDKNINLFSKFIGLRASRHVRNLTSFSLKQIEDLEL
jgi:hypothetical protein